MSVKNKISDVLLSKGFRLIDKDVSVNFGDSYCIYSNEIINIRLVSDKSIESVDVSSVLDFNQWIDLALIKALIYDEQDLSKIITVNEFNDFLENHLSKICDLLSVQNYSSTKKIIEVLEDTRVRQMFPKIRK